MKHMKTALSLMLAMLLLVSAAYAQEGSTPLSYSKGDKIKDFSFTTYDGNTYSLYDILQEKDAVLLNIWATWCGPCRSEFPYMQEAYEAYQDRIEIIALSCEPTDTPEQLESFANQYGLTFKVGQDPVDFLSALGMNSIPTSIMIDRFGTICFVEAGAQPDVGSFKRLFDAFLGEDYTESILLDAVPAVKPNVVPSQEADLTEALGVAATNPTNEYVWPMIVTEKDGRSVIASSNGKNASTRAEVSTTVTAKAGEAIVVTFKTSTEATCDLLVISVNDQAVKVFGGEHDWMTYAIPVDADGEYSVKLAYVKDMLADEGMDTVWIDSITVTSDADAALADNPVYPVTEETTLSVIDPAAREVTIGDPDGLLAANFGEAKYYIVNGDTATVKAQLSAEEDPEQSLLSFTYGEQSQIPLTQVMIADGYEATTSVDSIAGTGRSFTYVVLSLDATGERLMYTILFKDEANLNAFVKNNALGTWTYVDANPESDGEAAVTTAEYTFKCVDQAGNSVAGVMLQVCDAETCQVLNTDESGLCRFSGAPYAWEVHILRAPAGYVADSTEVVYAPVNGGEVVLTLTAN